MRFLLDAQRPPSLVKWLVEAGHAAVHVSQLGLRGASDETLWELARRDHLTILTKDEDFAALWIRRDRAVPVVWLRIGNCSRRALIEWLSRRSFSCWQTAKPWWNFGEARHRG